MILIDPTRLDLCTQTIVKEECSQLGQTQFHPLIYPLKRLLAFLPVSTIICWWVWWWDFKSHYKWGAETIRIDFGFGFLKKKTGLSGNVVKSVFSCPDRNCFAIQPSPVSPLIIPLFSLVFLSSHFNALSNQSFTPPCFNQG